MSGPATSSHGRHAGLLAGAIAVSIGMAVSGSAGAAAPPGGAPDVTAKAVYLWNPRTNDVLVQRNAETALPMASTTKIMTALLVLRSARQDDVVTVTDTAAAVGESEILLEPGEQITVRDLLRALMLKSANDAAVALAEHVAGSEAVFVARMNAEARRLGLRHTHFETPYGLDRPGHAASAHDLARLAVAAMKLPAFRTLVGMRRATIEGDRSFRNRNVLVGRGGVDGVKTGHTGRAGWCLVAHAERGPVELVGVILGGEGESARNLDMAELMDWGTTRYHRIEPVRRGTVFATVDLPDDGGTLDLEADGDARATVLDGTHARLEVDAASGIELPIRKGERYGTVRVFIGGRKVSEIPLVATRSVGEPSLWERFGRLLDDLF
jgi:D-alanyl-D-alanine carboxypeptidase (penicillin-binding protein 5/6)